MSATVTALSYTPVKGTRLHTADRLELGPAGAPGDRRFYLIDARGRMLNGKTLGALSAVVASLADGALTLEFPDRPAVSGPVEVGEPLTTRFYSRERTALLVEGPWEKALSEYLDQPVRLVAPDGSGSAIDRGARGGVSLVSRGSLDALAALGALDGIDARRFRMTVEIDGVEAHAEDAWVGSVVRIGGARVHFHGHVGRCLITSRHPKTGAIDVPTLAILERYRGAVSGATEPLPFGIHGEVLTPGVVAAGDAVALESA